MDITVVPPGEVLEGERHLFSALVLKGGEVGGNGLATNVMSAKVLVFGRVEGEVLGIAALKCPQRSYRKRISHSADIEMGQARYPYELGYVFVLPQAQGRKFSHLLVSAALACVKGAGVFATTRTDNAAMLATLAKAGFKQVGKDYRGRGARMIRLLVKD